jgi:hypothetical protein
VLIKGQLAGVRGKDRAREEKIFLIFSPLVLIKSLPFFSLTFFFLAGAMW